MEIVERFAYYGLRSLVPIYMVLAYEEGGPRFTHIQKGAIFGWWALVQSFLPVMSGGFADRYGFKLNIAIATILKMLGYLLMGYAIQIGAYFTGGDLEALKGAAGGVYTYPLFFAGAMLLAGGTAIFKPGLQGLIALKMPKEKASIGWAVFYQMVNVGAFVGPLIGGYLRVLSWENVFLMCTAGIALNFIPLMFFPEPDRNEADVDGRSPVQILKDSFTGLAEVRVLGFTLSFAGFWFMAYSLWDFLPNFIDDWVDSRGLGAWLQSWVPGDVPIVDHGMLAAEWMVNFNAFLIMFLAFAMGWLTGKVRSLTAIVIGIAISALSIWMLGVSMDGWFCLLAIGVFSFGEMSASPTKMRYLASIAPPGKEGLYMGYVNMTVGIGWSILNFAGGHLYEDTADKVNLAKRHLVDALGMEQSAVDALQKTEVMPTLAEKLSAAAEGANYDVHAAREFLWGEYAPYEMWNWFAAVGIFSMILMLFYDRWARKNPLPQED
ncbi:MAG: MFS transporter [Planctomycetes bacterium]|nr:MFS transporter [Planctomycetota bacterium]